MSNISPKLISVELNRVEPDEGYLKIIPGIVEGKNPNIFNDGNIKTTGHKNKVMVMNINGRFPTQLFTNNKKEQYKYVKEIKEE